MIRNIVFDMGKVLLDYDALKICWQYTDNPHEVELLDKALFSSPEWIMLDKGVITEEAAMEIVKKRLPEKRLKDIADLCMEHWHEYNIRPKEGMEELVKELKANGCHLYLCSNASLRLRIYQEQIPGIQHFDGILVSAEELLIKPDPAIYLRLFDKFSIKPEESYFIDDMKANIAGAKAVGMDGYCFADGDVSLLRKELKRLGVLTVPTS